MTSELEDLFNRDPLNLTKDDLRRIIKYLRQLRHGARPAPKRRTRKPKVVPTEIRL